MLHADDGGDGSGGSDGSGGGCCGGGADGSGGDGSGGGGGVPDVPVIVTQFTPPSCVISVAPTTIQVGDTVTLSWYSTNATGATITATGDFNLGPVSPTGSTVIQEMPGTRTWTMVVTGPGGSASCQTTVVVQTPPPPPPPQAPVCTLAASVSTVQQGGAVTLSWTSGNATSASLSGIGAVGINGSYTVNNLQSSQTFTLTVNGPGGTANCSAAVSVTPPPPPPPAPVCTITASPSTIASGGSITASWSSSNATSAVLDGVGGVGVNGSYTWSNVTSNGNVVLRVHGPGGDATCQAPYTVTQTPPPPPPGAPQCVITASPSSIMSGGSITASWSSSNATSVILDGVGTVGVNGSYTWNNVTSSGKVILRVHGPGGDATCEAPYTVQTPPPQAPACVISANPSSISLNGHSTLTWSSSNATAATLTSNGSVPVNGSLIVSPVMNTTYTLTVTGPGGTATCQTPVTVTTTPPPPSNGCIDVVKETFNSQGQVLTPVTQFSFRLDSDGSIQNDSAGHARFTNVTPGTHTVTETVPSGWTQLSATPAGGTVIVPSGNQCATVVFKNQQTPPPPPQMGCIDIIKETYNNQGQLITPVAQFSFRVDNGGSVFNDSTGRVHIDNVTPGTHTVTEIIPSGWTQMSTNPSGGVVNVVAGNQCSVVTIRNQQSIPQTQVPTCTLSSNPTNVQYGGSSNFTWSSTNATSATFDGVGTVGVNGSYTVNNITSNRTYVLTVTGPGGTATCQAPVVVAQIPPPQPQQPYCTISANPTGITQGQSSNLTWTSYNATNATLSTVGSIGVNGTYTVWPQQTTTYALTVYNAQGQSATCYTSVGVSSTPYVPPYQPPYQPPVYQPPYQPQVAGAYISLSQIPYTGDYGPVGDALFWIAMVGFALAGSYLLLYWRGGAITLFRETFPRRTAYLR